MKDITYALAVFFCTLISFGQCDYSLKMIDSYGDGWNGNTMNVSVNGSLVLTGVTIPSGGSELILPFMVTDGADVTTEWLGGGGFGYETSYEILDSTGTSVLSEAENSITTGTITASCPSCVAPTALIVDSTSDTGAVVSWTAEAGDAAWQYELVLTGETPTETGTDTTDNPLTITGCYANTGYDLYIRTDCGDSESTWGMVSFTTLPVPFTMPGCFDFETGVLGANAGLSSDIYSDASLDAGAAAFASDFGILLTGGDSSTGWTGGGSDTTETEAWVDNVTHQSAVSITVDATAETVVVLTFDLKQTYSFGAKYSNFRVTANGTQIGGTLNPTTAGADSFVNQYYDLSAYAGTSFNLKLEHSGKYNAAYSTPGDQSLIDNICITAPSCTQPSAATVAAVTASSANMSWTLGATETSWNIEYGPAGFTEGTGTTDTATTTAYNLTGLDSDTTYHFYVQADCGDSTSNWVGPVEFTTSPGCGDTLFDSGGATGNYSSNDLTTVTIYPDNTGDLVTFTFISFETEANYDFLTVYDGPDVSATVVGVYDGATVPDAITSSHSTGALTFVFDSDGSSNRSGYEILISCSPAPSCLQVSDLVVSTATGSTADISWTANNGETAWEYVIQAQGTGAPTAAGISITTNPYTITGLDSSTDYEVFVRAICDATDSSPWRGPVNFTTSPACGDTLYDSGGATGNYSSNDLTTVTVYPDNTGDLVTFTFISFETEANYDFLTVYDGPDVSATVVGVYDGATAPDAITSSHPTGALTFKFDSDGSSNRSGYEILISCSPAPSCLQVSDLVVSTATGSTADISWTANNGETAWEYVIQAQGTGAPTAAGIAITTNPFTITGLDSATEYEVFVRAICDGTEPSDWRGPINFTTSPACGDTLYDSGGATGNYSSNEFTTVTVYADTAGDLVTFTFLSFETETNWDTLTVYDGPDVSATEVGVYSGSIIPDPITSSHPTGALTFVFDSDGSVNDPGYEILISCAPAPTCLQVSDVTATNATTTTVDLGWTAYNTEVLWNIEYGPADFVQGAGTTTVANSNPFTLTGLDNNATYDFYVQADCGDGDTSAWVGPLSFTTLPVPFTMPGCFDFEDGVLGANAALSSEIYADASLDAGAAAFASDFGILLTGGDSGTGWTGGSTSTTETEAWVDNITHQSAVSITVDATAETVVVLTFDLKQTYSYGPNYSNFRVTVDGAQIGATLNPTTESSDPFVNQYYDLSAYAGTSFDLKLEHSGKYDADYSAPGDQSLIDNICITAPTCTQPGAAIAEAITTSTADISWTLGDAETAWNIEYGPAGFTQGTGTTDTTAAMAYDLSGLESNTTYHFYVQADCGTSTSNWVGPLAFTTAPSCGDTLFDSGGATGDYSGNESITVTIYPETAGDLVTFTFLNFETEANWDLFTVYDGPDATSDVLGSFSGANVPDPVSSTDATGALTFVFESDGFANDPGYEILISCAPAPSCYPPTALTISNIAGTTADFDWTGATGNSSWEYIIVPTGDPAPTGSGSAATVASTQFTGLDFETTYDVYVRANCGDLDGFSTWSGPVTFTTTQQTNYTVDCASGVPVNINYCYENNDTMFWVFTSTTGFPLKLTFNAGTIESFSDDITIYDGLDNTGTVLFNNNTNNMNNLAGLVIESTSTSMYIEVDSDFSVSCESSSSYTAWDFDVSCKSCITQTVAYDIIGDCEVSQEFFIEVDISDLGSATSVVVSDNLASATQTVTSTGVITFGPYTTGFNVIITAINSDDDSCEVNSSAMTFLCPPPPNDCSIIYAGEDTTFCEGTSTNLTAAYHILGQDTSAYEVNLQQSCPMPALEGGTPTSLDIDDTWSDAIDLGFEFCFFGETYSQILIGSNGVLSFEFENAGGGNGYNLDSDDTLPNSSNSTLSEANIFGVGHDINPSVCGDINYVILGASPSRQFVVNYSEVCHFGSSCGDNKSSSQIILYESSNAIDVNIYDKPTCTAWNDGNAVVGVQNVPGTVAFTPPGRNTGVWDATDEFWRFTPSLGDPDFTIEWFDGTTSVGTGETVTVAPSVTTTYTAAITYNLCTGGTATITDTVEVGINPTPEPIATESTIYRCSGEESILEVTVTNSDVLASMTYYWTYDGVDVQSGPDNTYTVPADSDQTGEYFVTVIDERDCFGETTITLVAGVTPQLEEDTIFTKCMNEDTEISVNVLNMDLLGSDLEYVWYIGGTEVQSGSDYIYTHVAQQAFGTVTVVVMDLNTMCEASTTIEVAGFMNADCVDIPQGLSPNGDGVNDCLVLDHLEASDDIVKAEIYNRYGVKVFELNDYTSQWCGQDTSSGNSNSNELLPVGTYFYVIQFNSGRAPITSWIYLNY